MKLPVNFLNAVILTSLFYLIIGSSYAQESVGIGTETPNPNAVVDIVTTGNQGLLLPRMTTAQRTNTSLTSILTVADNGLTVFDTDEGRIYFWFAGNWINSSLSLNAGAGIDFTGGIITNTGDTDPADDVTLTMPAAGDISGDYTGLVVEAIQGRPVLATLPTADQVLVWNGTAWEPTALSSNGITYDNTSSGLTNDNIQGAIDELAANGTTDFSTDLEIPRGDGTSLVSSNLFSDGTNIGIGTSTPSTQLQIADRTHLFQFLDQNGNEVTALSSNFYLTSPTTFERTVTGPGAFMILSPDSGIEFFKVEDGANGAITPSDFYSIGDMDSAQFRLDGVIEIRNNDITFENSGFSKFINMPDNISAIGFDLTIRGSDGDTKGGDIFLQPGANTTTGTHGVLDVRGPIVSRSANSEAGSLKLDGALGNTVTLAGPNSSGGDYTIALPSFEGTTGDVLTYTSLDAGLGELSWASSTAHTVNNEVPVGNGTEQVSSNIFSDGTSIGIGAIPSAGAILQVSGDVSTSGELSVGGALSAPDLVTGSITGTSVNVSTLNTSGNIVSSGNIQANGDFNYSSVQTRALSYDPTEFRIMKVAGQAGEVVWGGPTTRYVYFDGVSGIGYASVGVRLPQGAVVTSIVANILDNSATSFLRVRLSRRGLADLNGSTMAVVETTDVFQGATVLPYTDNTVFNGTVDNDNFTYVLRMEGQADALCQLFAIKVTYTVSKVD